MLIDRKEKIQHLPKSPGIYQFLDNTGDVLYVGKAKNLKNRVKSYFAKTIGRGPVIDKMMEVATDLKVIETESEIEAILLEADLINHLKPKFNSRAKDDKSFLVIKITKNELKAQSSKLKAFSCVELVRYKNVDFKDKSAEYFGPYPSGELLKKSLRYLRKIFPYRDCSKTKFCTYQKKGRPCIYGDIGICTGPCVNAVTVEDYNQNITYLKQFLRGKKTQIIKKLEKEMNLLSRLKKYEDARIVRDKLLALNHLSKVAVGLRDDSFSGMNILFKRIECYDISNIGDKYAVGSMVVFTDGKADKDEYRRFRIKNSEFRIKELNNDLSRLKQVLERRFKNDWPMPDLVVIDGGENQLKVAIEVIKKYEIDRPVVSIAKGAKRDKNEFHYGDANIVRYIKNNKNLINIIISARDESHRFAIAYYRKLHTKDMIER